mmetsp:Transcript_34697/g.64240  ORF Transcript_34697/g.64240 Transcript_34697/m.64240 type:complete len:132 (-) Transcript_34697:166-561(-)
MSLVISVATRHDLLSKPMASTSTAVSQPRACSKVRTRAATPIFSASLHSAVPVDRTMSRKVSVNSEEPQRRKGPGTISREDEADDYWMSKDEREGKSPLQDPLAWSAIAGLIVPFVILGIAIGTGYVPIGG